MRKQKKPTKRKNKNKNNDDDDDDDDDGFTMANMGNYFSQTYDTLSDYLPAMPLLSSKSEHETDNKRKKIRHRLRLRRNSTNPNEKSAKKVVVKDKDNRWYDKFFMGSDEYDDPVTEASDFVAPSDESGFLNWFADDEEKTGETVNTGNNKQGTTKCVNNCLENQYCSCGFFV